MCVCVYVCVYLVNCIYNHYTGEPTKSDYR